MYRRDARFLSATTEDLTSVSGLTWKRQTDRGFLTYDLIVDHLT